FGCTADSLSIFVFNPTASPEISTLSLHDALPISDGRPGRGHRRPLHPDDEPAGHPRAGARGAPGPRGPRRRATRTRCQRARVARSEEHTSELQSRGHLVCRLLLDKKKTEIMIDVL